MKQQKLAFISPNSVSQNTVNKLTKNFVIKGLHPLSIVERDEFRDLIQGLQPGKTIMARTTLVSEIKKDADEYRLELKATLAEIEHVATTGDLWTAHGRLVSTFLQ